MLSLFSGFHALSFRQVSPYQNADFLSSRELNSRLNECTGALLSTPVKTYPAFFALLQEHCAPLSASGSQRIGTRANALLIRAITAMHADDYQAAIKLLHQSQAFEPNTYWLARIRLLAWMEISGSHAICKEVGLMADLELIRQAPERRAHDVTGLC